MGRVGNNGGRVEGPPAAPDRPRLGRDGGALLLGAGLAAALALVYGAALGHPFLPSHDDGDCILWNPAVQGSWTEAVRGAFTTRPLGAWAPLHQLAHRLDRALFGEWAGGSVLVNLGWHGLTALLLGLLVLRLGAGPLAAAAAALLFALHPVQVEAVAWISQRKTVMAGAFMAAALLCWVEQARASGARRRRWWLLALLAAAAAMLSKAVAVVLPVALLLLDVPLGRARPRGGWLLEKLPFAALAVAVAWLTVGGKTEVASALSEAGHTRAAAGGATAWHGGGPAATFLTMTTVLPRYLGLLAWPDRLSAIYLPAIHTGLDAAVAGGLALLAALAALLAVLARRAPRLFLWVGLFLLGLAPVSQVVPQVTLMNDRYLYAPLLGGAALAGELAAAAWARLRPRWRPALAVALAGILLALALVARARVPAWSSDLALWGDAAAKAPGSPHAWYNLGRAREAAGDDAGALPAYRQALALDPLDDLAAVNAGAALLRSGALEEAAPLVELGARLAPASLEARFNLALLRHRQGRRAEAAAELERAAALDPLGRAVRALRQRLAEEAGPVSAPASPSSSAAPPPSPPPATRSRSPRP